MSAWSSSHAWCSAWAWRATRARSAARSACWRATARASSARAWRSRAAASSRRRAGRSRPMLGVLVAVGGVGDQAGLVGWGLVDELGEPVPLGAELVGGHAPQVQGGGGADVDRQLLAAVAAQALGQLLADVAPLGVGHVQLGGARLGVGDPVEPGGAAGAGVLHLVPVAVLGAAHVHQRMLAGQPLGLVPGGGIAKVDGAPVGVAPGPPAGPL